MATKQIHDLPHGTTVKTISEIPMEREDTTIPYKTERFFVGQLADQDTIKNPDGVLEVDQTALTDLVAINPITTSTDELNTVLEEIYDAAVKVDKTFSGFAGSEYKIYQNAIQTTDATPTEIPGISLNVSESCVITGRVCAADSAHENGVGGRFEVFAQRAAGDIAIVGSTEVKVDPTGLGTFTIVANTAGQYIAVQATGEEGITYNWVVTFEYNKVLTNA